MQTNIKLVQFTYTMLQINNDSNKYKNLDIIDNIMLTYSSIKIIDGPLFTLYVVIHTQTCRSKLVIRKGRVYVPCSRGLCTPTLDTSQHDKETWCFWIKHLNLDVCMHTTTYIINNGTSTNFIEDCDNIMLSRTNMFSYALTSLWGWWFISEARRTSDVYELLGTLHKLHTIIAVKRAIMVTMNGMNNIKNAHTILDRTLLRRTRSWDIKLYLTETGS